MKIIPAIDLMDGKVVRLTNGDPKLKTVYSDDPLTIAKKLQDDGADMIHLVDLDATLSLGSNFSIIEKIVKTLSVPVQVAGGLRDEETIDKVITFAQRIVIGTLAFRNKDILQKILEKYGKEKIVISVDHFDGKVAVNGWKENTDLNLMTSLKDFVRMGFSEFLVTNVNRDGTLQGPDLKFLNDLCDIPEVNIISSGGISNMEDIKKVKETNAFGVILGKALYENLVSIKEAKKIA
jgi:phosphoribosylformimino-5-aminoimidazole carboxamide ribotide isomerase